MEVLARCFIVEPRDYHDNSIILLHGRGSNGKDFASELFECSILLGNSQETSLPQRFPNTRWIFPNAKLCYFTRFQEEMTEWFDIYSLTYPDERFELQKDGLIDTINLLSQLVQIETRTISSRKVIIRGISQGFAVSALALLSLDIGFGGLLGLSGWLPLTEAIGHCTTPAEVTTQLGKTLSLDLPNRLDGNSSWVSTPIFIGHEENDAVVDCDLGKAAFEKFRNWGAKVEWHTYDSADHWIQEPDEIKDIADFISRCMH